MTRADYEQRGYDEAAERRSYHLSSYGEYLKEGWRRQTWLDGAWRWMRSQPKRPATPTVPDAVP